METPNNDIQNDMPVMPASSSRLGIASLVLAIVGLITYCIPFGTGFVLGATDNVSVLYENPALTNGLNIIGYCGNFIGLIALVLGGISIAKEEKKGLGIAGVVLSVLLTCGCLATIIISMTSQL